MALVEGGIYSDILGRHVNFSAILPHDVCEEPMGGFSAIYLLHGRGDDQRSWLLRSNIERYAIERGLAVVMPDAAKSFYCDAKYGDKYFTFFIDEFIKKVSRMMRLPYSRDNTYIGGVSMGGYGAIKCALLCPENFAGCLALSPVTDITEYVSKDCENGNYDMWRGLFGEELEIPKGDDLFSVADNAYSFVSMCPRMYIACGKLDELYEQNVRFKDFLDSRRIDFTFEQAQAGHEWSFWDVAVQRGLDIILPRKR